MGLRAGWLAGWLAGLVAAGAAVPGRAHDFKAGDLEVAHPYALATPPTARAGAGYFSVTNRGDTPDTLVGVTVAAPLTAEIHATEMRDGVARMVPVAALEIPAGSSVTLAPRGLHVMFTGLAAPWSAGDRIAATLTFEQAGAVPVVFNVEARPAAGEHSGHEPSGHEPSGHEPSGP